MPTSPQGANESTAMPRLPDFYYQQMAGPHGRLARVSAGWMNLGNTVINRQAVEALEVDAADHVLEVGFGGGVGIALLLDRGATVVGIDPSERMVEHCAARFASDIASGRLEILRGAVEALPGDDSRFTRVLAVNTVYFWRDLADACSQLFRVVAPCGRVVVATSSAATCRFFRWGEKGFLVPEEETVLGGLRSAGFARVRVDRRRNIGGTRLFIAEK
jgi:arsenite methyltransferase